MQYQLKRYFLLVFFLIFNIENINSTTIDFGLSAGITENKEELIATGGGQIHFLWGKYPLMAGIGGIKVATFDSLIYGFEALDLVIKYKALMLGVFYGLKYYDLNNALKFKDIDRTSGLFLDYDLMLSKSFSIGLQIVYEYPLKDSPDSPNLLPVVNFKYWWW